MKTPKIGACCTTINANRLAKYKNRKLKKSKKGKHFQKNYAKIYILYQFAGDLHRHNGSIANMSVDQLRVRRAVPRPLRPQQIPRAQMNIIEVLKHDQIHLINKSKLPFEYLCIASPCHFPAVRLQMPR